MLLYHMDVMVIGIQIHPFFHALDRLPSIAERHILIILTNCILDQAEQEN